MLSPEDIAWADSCFAKDIGTLENGWDSLKNALFNTLTVQSESSLFEKDKSCEEVTMRFSSSSKETVQTQDLDESIPSSNTASRKREISDSNNDESKDENTDDDFWLRHKAYDVFLPTYNEDLKDLGLSDPEMDFAFQASETEQTMSDIFKIWELNFPPEEDDLVKQLNKAFDEGSLPPTSSVSDNPEAMKELKDMSIDDLVSGIAGLSLNPS